MSTAVITVNAGSNSLRLDLVEVTDGREPQVHDSHHTGSSPTGEESLGAFDSFIDRHGADAACLGHRLVHGGELIQRPREVDENVPAQLRAAEPLAPQHVPAARQLVERARDAYPALRQIVCPDTAFHTTMPEQARAEPLPRRWRSQVRRFGFHGLSYAWALQRAAKLLDRPAERLNTVIAHLSGGCSVCAVRDGRSVDTTMGFTPHGGITMSRRSGDLDPGTLFWLLRNSGESLDEVEQALGRESGLLGLSDGLSNDTRDLVAAAERGDAAAGYAIDVFCRRTASGIASMATNLQTLDALVLTGDIGWNQPEVRSGICERLGLLGIPSRLSGNRDDDGFVGRVDGRPPVIVIEPREELQMAIECHRALVGR
ncbi:acetate/propionate family kinase [Saccharopolyspora halophila]|uniref:Acetate kinase n=1 Tax=Saccharopolyspora halophila TaxID=405551 RepID=A0ABP5T6G0_9PSEU